MTFHPFEYKTEASEQNLEDSITVCLCTVQKMYSAGSIDEQQRDSLKELVFGEDPELLSYFCQPGSDSKTLQFLGILILKISKHELDTAKFTTLPKNDNTF